MLSLRGQAVLLFCTSLVACHTAGPTQTGALTTAAAVHRLSTEEASTRPQVHLSGTITVIDEFSRIMFVQDGTGPVFLSIFPGAAMHVGHHGGVALCLQDQGAGRLQHFHHDARLTPMANLQADQGAQVRQAEDVRTHRFRPCDQWP